MVATIPTLETTGTLNDPDDVASSHDPRTDRPAIPAVGEAGAYLLFVLAVALAMASTMSATIDVWRASPTHLHGAFAAPAAAVLVFLRRREWGADAGGSHRPLAFAALLAALSLWLCGRAAGLLIVEQTALVGALLAGFVFLCGRPRATRFAAPLALLLFFPPLGDVVLGPMQGLTTHIVHALLWASGLETAREGLVLTTAAGAFAITEACAGARMLSAILMAGLLIACLALRTRRAQISLLGAAFFAGLIANWARVYIVILVTDLSGGDLALAKNHDAVGAAAFAAAVLTLFILAEFLAQRERAHATPPPLMTPAPFARPTAVGRRLAAAVGLALAFGAYGALVVAAPPPRDVGAALHLTAEGWRAEPSSTQAAPVLAHADRESVTLFREADADREVQARIGVFAPDRPKAEAAGHLTDAAISDARVRPRRTIDARVLGRPAARR